MRDCVDPVPGDSSAGLAEERWVEEDAEKIAGHQRRSIADPRLSGRFAIEVCASDGDFFGIFLYPSLFRQTRATIAWDRDPRSRASATRCAQVCYSG